MGDPQERFTNAVVPYTEINETNKALFYRGTVANHLGLPALDGQTIHADGEVQICAFPFIAYQLMYDEFLRNPWTQSRIVGDSSAYAINLQTYDHTAIGDLTLISQQRWANYDADYFMGALPEAYSGSSSEVELDLDLSYTAGTTGRVTKQQQHTQTGETS